MKAFTDSCAEPIVLDKLTYAGNLENLTSVDDDPCYQFVRSDIVDGESVRRILDEKRPRALVHFAAESHVDRSILGPGDFVRTNIEGTFQLLEAHGDIGRNCPPKASVHFASYISPTMKSMVP